MISEGSRVLVFDSDLFVDDRSTPLSVTMKPATVIRRYGLKYFTSLSETGFWLYPDLVDVEFDHRRGESRSHFTYGVRELQDGHP